MKNLLMRGVLSKLSCFYEKIELILYFLKSVIYFSCHILKVKRGEFNDMVTYIYNYIYNTYIILNHNANNQQTNAY